MKNSDNLRRTIISKIAKEDKNIDTVSALATAGGAAGGSVGGSLLGERIGKTLPQLSHKVDRLSDLKGDELSLASRNIRKKLADGTLRPEAVGLTGDANIRRIVRKQFMKNPKVVELLQTRRDYRAALQKMQAELTGKNAAVAKDQERLSTLVKNIVWDHKMGFTKEIDPQLYFENLKNRQDNLTQAIKDKITAAGRRADVKEKLINTVMPNTRGRARNIYDKILMDTSNKAVNRYNKSFAKGVNRASQQGGKIGAIAGGTAGSLALGGLMYSMTNPKTRAKIAEKLG